MLPYGCVMFLVLFSGWRNLVLSVPGYFLQVQCNVRCNMYI